jgi:hypothetical protein
VELLVGALLAFWESVTHLVQQQQVYTLLKLQAALVSVARRVTQQQDIPQLAAAALVAHLPTIVSPAALPYLQILV